MTVPPASPRASVVAHGTAFLLACLVVVLAAVSAGARQDPAPSVEIESPEDGSYVSGPTLLRARVLPPSATVERVTFYADGKVACVVERRPFECQWDAGPGVNEHQIRVVAQLADGSTVRRTVRTKEVAYADAVDVDIVQVTASVTDRDGKFVRNLRRDTFRILENGVPQTITSFHAENTPLELVIAVDVSGSMTDAMPQVKAAVTKFLSALRPSDKVTLLAFNDNVFTLARPTADLQTRLKAVDRLAPWGGTAFYEVIIRALEMQGRGVGRRAVVIFTDGEDRNSRVPIADAERRLEASDAVVYFVGQGQGVRVPALKAIIERLAKKSGGRAFFAESADKLDEPFAQVVEELANQYLLGYPPHDVHKDDAWRVLKVEVADKDLRVRARQGYRPRARMGGAK
jgi:VWFA-related protein